MQFIYKLLPYVGSFLLTLVSFVIIGGHVSAAEIPGRSLNVVITQTGINTFQVLSITTENNNPKRYMVTLADNFLLVRQMSGTTVLFEGQVKHTKIDIMTNQIPAVYGEVPDSPLTMHLPYFDDANNIKVYDKTGFLVLDIDLANYGIGPTPTPGPRYADCNKCGFCRNSTKQPGNIDSCMACLYPEYSEASYEATLLVDPASNQPVQPAPGKYYSQLGCIDVGIAGFRDPAAAGGVLNVIMNRLIFPIAGVLSLISLIYGAFLVMSAQGNPEQIGRGKRWIYGAIIGVVFIFSSILIIRIIAGDLLKIPGFDI